MSRARWLQEIEEQAGAKPVLLVEGNTDATILAYFLSRVATAWTVRFNIFQTGYKKRVFDAVKIHTDWIGIIDRDEWGQKQITAVLRQTSRVKVLPRFCLENFFCVPDELWAALSPPLKQSLKNNIYKLKEPVEKALPKWVAHGAMWRVLRNRRTALFYETGFPTELERKPVTDLAKIRQILGVWYEQLNPDKIIRDYQKELKSAQKKTVDNQLKSYIHGKRFFSQVVVKTLNNLFGQASTDVWLERLTGEHYGLKVPPDLQEFLQEILDQF